MGDLSRLRLALCLPIFLALSSASDASQPAGAAGPAARIFRIRWRPGDFVRSPLQCQGTQQPPRALSELVREPGLQGVGEFRARIGTPKQELE